jgi:hypothetical protein
MSTTNAVYVRRLASLILPDASRVSKRSSETQSLDQKMMGNTIRDSSANVLCDYRQQEG